MYVTKNVNVPSFILDHENGWKHSIHNILCLLRKCYYVFSFLPTQNNNIATLSILCICWLMSRYIYYCLILYGYQQREGRLKGWQYVSTLNCNWGRIWRHLNWINKNISRILSFIEQYYRVSKNCMTGSTFEAYIRNTLIVTRF